MCSADFTADLTNRRQDANRMTALKRPAHGRIHTGWYLAIGGELSNHPDATNEGSETVPLTAELSANA